MFKVVLQRTFLFQQMNDICTCITEIVIILKKIKQLFIERNNFISLFCAINRTAIEVLFKISRVLSQQCHHA